jgi:hypothetical protein
MKVNPPNVKQNTIIIDEYDQNDLEEIIENLRCFI